MAVKLMKRLENYSGKISIHDKLDETYTNFYKEFDSNRFHQMDSVNDLASKSEVVIYCNDDTYEKPTMIISNIDTIKIIDPWRTI